MMPPKTDQSNLKALAETVNIETLVDRVRRGLIRVPIFQRKLRWESKDVLALFDSVHRGYPVGSFLFSKRKADAKRINMGPLLIDAPETPSAYYLFGRRFVASRSDSDHSRRSLGSLFRCNDTVISYPQP